ncbi:MAG: site-specific integrase [Pseudomonadota bacterium]
MYLRKFGERYGGRGVEVVSPDDILAFLTSVTEGLKRSTKRYKYTLLKSFFNFIRNNIQRDLHNPCDTPLLRKTFRPSKGRHWNILEKDVVDEIIFRTDNVRNRIMLELMARGGMRIGEVLKLKVEDADDQKLRLIRPKSGKSSEVVFIPQKVADRLKLYIRDKNLSRDERIFQIQYTAAREVVRKAGKKVGIHLRPHDLRRHAATYASRAGAPLEIVSKVILRHANLSTTQRYLGKVSDKEAIRWVETIYG